MAKNNSTSVYVAAGVFILIAVVFGVVIDSLVTSSTQTYSAFDTLAIAANNGTATLSNVPLVADSQVVKNSGGVTLVEGTNYTLSDTTGLLTLVNQNLTAGNVTYRYTGSAYLSTSLTRTVLVYLPVLFLLVMLVYLAMKFFLKGKVL